MATQTAAAATATAAEWTLTSTATSTYTYTPTLTSTATLTLTNTPTRTKTPSPTPALSATPTNIPSPTATPTATKEDYGYTCNLADAIKGLKNLDEQLGGIHIIETIKLDDTSPADALSCEVIAPEITDFKNQEVGSMLRLQGLADEALEKQKDAIAEQCKALSLSILGDSPPEIPGVTFERALINGKWVDGLSLDKDTAQLWLMLNAKTNQCEWKVLD